MTSSVTSPRVKSKLIIGNALAAKIAAHPSTFRRHLLARPALELRSDRPLVLGHRGASADAPENTIAAFREALRQGADGVELDVRRCASGELVVVHDATLERVAGEPLPVERSTLAELRRADLGRGWERYAGERIPTLEEVLAALPPEALIDVEIKAERIGDPILTRQVAEQVRGLDRRIVLTSFDPVVMTQARLHGWQVPGGILFDRPYGPRLRGLYGRAFGLSLVAPFHRLCSAERVATWHRMGLAVATWTVDEPADIERCCKAGVDVIISNRPGETLDWVRRLA